MDLEGFEPLTSRMRTERSPMRTLKKPPKDKTFLLKNGKKHRRNAGFRTSIAFGKKLPFLLQCKKSHTSGEMRFRCDLNGRPSEYFLRIITMRILSIIIFVIVYGRMIEIYCMVSLAPIPMATFGNHEQSHMGQNYLKCLFALGFQGFLILICVAIYAVLIQSVAISGDAINSIWSIVGYTVLLCFSLFKTSSVTKSVLGAH